MSTFLLKAMKERQSFHDEDQSSSDQSLLEHVDLDDFNTRKLSTVRKLLPWLAHFLSATMLLFTIILFHASHRITESDCARKTSFWCTTWTSLIKHLILIAEFRNSASARCCHTSLQCSIQRYIGLSLFIQRQRS